MSKNWIHLNLPPKLQKLASVPAPKFHAAFDHFDKLQRLGKAKHLIKEQLIPLLKEAMEVEKENGLFRKGESVRGKEGHQGPYLNMMTSVLNQHIPR